MNCSTDLKKQKKKTTLFNQDSYRELYVENDYETSYKSVNAEQKII